jgi:uncharacterized membrane protein YciS (DUF1049 family)
MTEKVSSRATGLGRVLVIAYAILALAATGRSIYQIAGNFSEAPLAYSLSGLAAVIYIVATVALIVPGTVWYRVAVTTISFELLGVVIVGSLSVFDPALFPDKTMWSYYGRGYWFVPLVLPVLGLLWLRARRPVRAGNEMAR